MHAKLCMFERDLELHKMLIDASMMTDVIVKLLISKGIATEDEISSETARVKSSEKYDFKVDEAERDIKVFRQMQRAGAEAESRALGLMKDDETFEAYMERVRRENEVK